MAVTPLAPGGAAVVLHREAHLGSFADAPLIAADGEWVQRYSANGCIRTLGRFAAPFPQPGSPEWAWQDYVDDSLPVPWAILAVGVVAAVALPLVLHFCHPKLRSRDLGPPWPFLYAAGGATLACVAITAFLGIQAQRASFVTASENFRGVYEDVRMSEKLAEALRVSGSAVMTDLQELNVHCPPNIRDLFMGSVNNILHEVGAYMAEVARSQHTTRQLPDQIEALELRTRSIGDIVAMFLGLPVVLTLLCCAAVVMTIYVIEHSSTKCAKRCEKCEMPCLALGCVAPAMLAVSLVAAAELGVGILSSGYCLHADKLSMGYAMATFGPHSNAFALSRYYLDGDGPNPALQHLSKAQVQIVDAIQWVRHYGDVTARSCPMWRKEDAVVLNLQTVQYSMNATSHLLSPYHVYPYYDHTMHEIICKRLPQNLAAAALFQMILALICLPALLCTASCVVDALIEERSVLHGLHKFERLAQDAMSDVEDAAKGFFQRIFG
mmetsp:Transcript_56952/g.165042  ORF Transcript_56952/g.165042 Transcript_56952/m.165042 type:complete len:495 (-) Transcript_56952:207-1691(-)